ncbi:MAG: hypothetical protein IKK63_04095 [Clostridia bacterium]|nr:hypothetical protein [Clostridia bacterium]
MNFIVKHENVITVRKASLYTAEKYVGKVYLIALRGSDFTWNKEDLNRTQNCLKSGFSFNTDYLEAVKNEAISKIPEGSFVVLIGHSLGGMIAQQFSADKEMKSRYNIINTLTMGSPFVITGKREGDLHRVADSGDAVPYLSPVLVANAFLGNYTYECCGYFGNPGGAHVDSYLYAEEWVEYDCFGVKNGTSKLVF